MRHLKPIDSRQLNADRLSEIRRLRQGISTRIGRQQDSLVAQPSELNHAHLVLGTRLVQREHFVSPDARDERSDLGKRVSEETTRSATPFIQRFWRLL